MGLRLQVKEVELILFFSLLPIFASIGGRSLQPSAHCEWHTMSYYNMHPTSHRTKYNITTGTLPPKISHTNYYNPNLPNQDQMEFHIELTYMLLDLSVSQFTTLWIGWVPTPMTRQTISTLGI